MTRKSGNLSEKINRSSRTVDGSGDSMPIARYDQQAGAYWIMR
jgi:hypothetical protein